MLLLLLLLLFLLLSLLHSLLLLLPLPYISSRESLIFSTSVKSDLMAAITVSLTLSRSGVDPRLVGLNRVALLHGPPGTGGDTHGNMIKLTSG